MAPEHLDVRWLADRLAIQDLHARYCRGIDRLDERLLRSVFHQDAVEHHGAWFDGPATEYVDRVLELAAGGFGLPSVHLIAAVTTEIVGDEAWSEAPFYSLGRVEVDGQLADYTFCARYLGYCQRRDGEWRFSARTLVHDVSRIDPVGMLNGPGWPAIPLSAEGSRSTSDPGYAFFAQAEEARRASRVL